MSIHVTEEMLQYWEEHCDNYDPEPYRAAFILENRVLGHCSLSPGYCCDTMRKAPGDCHFLFESWVLASYCGPEFIKKYKIPRKGGDTR
jgi:hypothetical protein